MEIQRPSTYSIRPLTIIGGRSLRGHGQNHPIICYQSAKAVGYSLEMQLSELRGPQPPPRGGPPLWRAIRRLRPPLPRFTLTVKKNLSGIAGCITKWLHTSAKQSAKVPNRIFLFSFFNTAHLKAVRPLKTGVREHGRRIDGHERSIRTLTGGRRTIPVIAVQVTILQKTI